MREVKTVCARDCPDSCFLTAVLDDGRIVSVRGDASNPVTDGITCPRAAADCRRVYSEKRVLYPHIRTDAKPGRGFRRVPWERAMEAMASRLKETIAEHGRESVLLLDYAGNTGLFSSVLPRRLWSALGATKTDHALCSNSGHAALALHYGLSYGLQPEELLEMSAITFWGFNARVSSRHLWALADKARSKDGATIIAVDPRRSETAEAADIWLSPRPGSDVALAYGVARHLIERGFVDHEFIEGWTRGYEEYREETLRWTPRRVEAMTGIPRSRIEELAEAYSKKRPGAFMIGIGLQKSKWGAEAVRAVSLLPALLGYHRGFYYTNSMGRFIDWGFLTGDSLTEARSRVVGQVDLGRRLSAGEFKFVFVYGMNPAVTLPDQASVRAGFTRGGVFVVVHDTHWTETADHADMVIPAPTFLEKDDIVISDSHPYVRIASKAVEPLGESRSEVQLMSNLADAIGIAEGWVYEDPWKAVERALAGAFTGGTVEDLMRGSTLRLKYKPRALYQTKTGKIELYSTSAEEKDMSPLPTQLPKVEEGGFILLNSALPNYLHTQFQDVYGAIPAGVWVNRSDAEALGIGDEDEVRLSNGLGFIKLHAKITDKIPRGVLWAPRHLTDLAGRPLNSIMPLDRQALGGGPTFNSTMVVLEPKSTGNIGDR